MVDREVSGEAESRDRNVSRRGFAKAVLVAVGAAVAGLAGLTQLRRLREQPPATTVVDTSAATPPKSRDVAELVLLNGKIITVDSNDSIVEAAAVNAGKYVKIGTSEEIRGLIDKDTLVVDLKGRTVTPGLVDSHCHIGGGYAEKYYLDLRPGRVDSISEIVELVAKKVSETPKGEWVLGFGWHPAYWKDRRYPNRFDLDPISPENPVFLTDMSGWYGWTNSYALRLAGIDENTPNPPGGVIDRDKTTNAPTGLLVNHSAMWLVKRPSPSKKQLEEGIKYASNLFSREGVTGIIDNWVRGRDLLTAYQSLNSQGEPTTPTDIYYLVNSVADAEAALKFLSSIRQGFGDRVKLKGWKLQVDGGAATAFTYEPHRGYAHSIPSLNPETLKTIVSMLHKSGLQICVHVIGDKALDVTLDAFEAALSENPRSDHRHRLEHVVVSPSNAALERIRRLGLVVSTQTQFIYFSGDTWLRLFGKERLQRGIPVKTAVDMGIPVALGSDYPCSPDTSPQMTLWSAISRQSFNGELIGPQERVDIKQALRLHTMGSAYAAHEEDIKGSIEVGKQADLVVWSDDIYSIPTDKIRDMKAELTIIKGQVVHKSSDTEVAVVPGSEYLSS
ncbi:MAG: amidohydrolase [Candidatus Bathyarchaeia archaeon]